MTRNGTVLEIKDKKAMTEQPQSNVLKVPLAKEQTFLSKMIQKYEKNVIEM